MNRLAVSPRLYPAFDKLIFAVFVLFVPAAMGSGKKIFGDGDVSWHVAAGRWILAHGRIPTTDPFSFTMAGRPWVAFEWLAEIVYGFAFNGAGYAGLAAVVTLAIMALHLIVFASLRRRVGPLALLVAIFSMDLILVTFLLARPHVLVWPLLALWTAVLLDCRDRQRRPPLALAGLMLVWANLHGSFLLGFAVAGAIGLDALIAARWDRRTLVDWLSFGLAALLAASLNANGIAGMLDPFVIMRLDNLSLIGEWMPSSPTSTPLFYGILIGTLAALLFRGVKLRLGELLLLLFLLAMAFAQVRHQSWLAIIGALILAPRLALANRASAPPPFTSPSNRRMWFAGAGAAAGLILALRLALPLQPPENVANPRNLLAHIPANLRSQPVLNEYSFGGPLILAGIKPYIDGRSDMYGDAFMANYDKIADGDMARFNREVGRYGITWTMLPPDLRLTAALDHSPQWRRVYADATGVIHVRLPPTDGPQSSN